MKISLTGAVLAGGRSSRMGSDKALLQWKGKPFVGHTADILSEVCLQVVIIGDKTERFSDLSYSCFEDIIPSAGPLGGIHSALTHSTIDHVLVCACDLPLISAGVLESLVGQRSKDSEITIARYNDVTQPLLGIYERRCLSKLSDFLEKGGRKVREFLKQCRTETVDLQSLIPGLSEDILLNVNTVEDYRRIKAEKANSKRQE
ncbi:MAG: molybdenum cofactor guanylyltransferase [Ignavibacteriales bacterium]|nr:molybdenum cofactor guanylyltransferase [Ignavibacteriales bacterium]